MERKAPPASVNFPKPWDDGPCTREQWEKYKHKLMPGAATGYGKRPEEWWLYEKSMEPPERDYEPRKLYEMGELAGVELERCLTRWRDDLEAGENLDRIPESILRELEGARTDMNLERSIRWVEKYCVNDDGNPVVLTADERRLRGNVAHVPHFRVTGRLANFVALLLICGPMANVRRRTSITVDADAVWRSASERLRKDLKYEGGRIECRDRESKPWRSSS